MIISQPGNIVWPSRPERHKPSVVGHPWEPWLVRSCITWLELYLNAQRTVLEIGGGASSIWFAKRAASVVTIEHDAHWCEWIGNIRRLCSIDNLTVIQPPDESVAEFIQAIPAGAYDLVVVDGAHRLECLCAAPGWVKATGVILLDNAEVPPYCNVTFARRRAYDFSDGLVVEKRIHTTRIWLPEEGRDDLNSAADVLPSAEG